MAAVFAAAILGGAPAASVQGQGSKGDVNVLVAGKHLDNGDWGANDSQGELGVMTNWQGPGWPVAAAADFLGSSDESSISRDGFTEQRGRTSEIDLGARKVWRPTPHLRPYAGGGPALVSAELDRTGPFGRISDRDSGVGLWVDGGVFWTLGESFNLGFDTRLSAASVRLFGVDRNAGGLHLGVLAGWHWGG